jgi:hypothetical protein
MGRGAMPSPRYDDCVDRACLVTMVIRACMVTMVIRACLITFTTTTGLGRGGKPSPRYDDFGDSKERKDPLWKYARVPKRGGMLALFDPVTGLAIFWHHLTEAKKNNQKREVTSSLKLV